MEFWYADRGTGFRRKGGGKIDKNKRIFRNEKYEIYFDLFF